MNPVPRDSVTISPCPVALAVALTLTGCASAPEPNYALDEARVRYELTSRDPEVASLAPNELEDAGTTLRHAERTWWKDEDAEKTAHLSYLAEQKVALARVQAELKEYKAQQTARGLVLTVDDVLFETNSANLRAGALLGIEPLVTFLQDNPAYRVVVEGHTDSTGPATYNEQLSQARASSVADYLASRGVSPGRIVGYGYGERYPVASNATAQGKQQNRRVDLLVLHQDTAYLPPLNPRA